jgi:hypothetical protein
MVSHREVKARTQKTSPSVQTEALLSKRMLVFGLQTVVFQRPECSWVFYRRRAATPTIPARAPEIWLTDAAPVYCGSISMSVADWEVQGKANGAESWGGCVVRGRAVTPGGPCRGPSRGPRRGPSRGSNRSYRCSGGAARAGCGGPDWVGQRAWAVRDGPVASS